MQRKSKRKIVVFVALLVALSAFVGYGIWNKPHRDVRNATPVKVDAVTLYKILSGKNSYNKSDFNNKVLSVSGTVKQVLENHLGQQVILLKTDIEEGAVNCTMEEKFENVKAGDSVLLKGICIGYNAGDLDLPGDVFLIRCYHSS
ncbi:MAG: OB-fold protein [Ginsengibacter sp.]